MEQLIMETESSILELIISESIKDMVLYEEDLEPVFADLEKDELSDLFFEKFIPYFEFNLLQFNGNNVLFEEWQPMQNAKKNVQYYKGLLGKKLQPMSLLGPIKSGLSKAAKSTQDRISNIGKTVGAGVAKRLNYASQNLKKASEIVKAKTNK